MDSKKKVFVCGNFNVLHPGHIRILSFASKLGELNVGVRSDRLAEGDVFVPELDRLEGIKSLTCVSNGFILDQDVALFLKKFQPDIVVKGKEHENLENPEKSILDSYGGKLIFSSGEFELPISEFDRRNNKKKQSFQIPSEYLLRHKINCQSLSKLIKIFSDLRVCVIGDVIVDGYIETEPLGMSQEEPTIVVMPVSEQKYLGGSGIVAAHSSSLGAKTYLLGVVGGDDNGKFVAECLRKYSISGEIVLDTTRPTTFKKRYRALGKSLLRVNFLQQRSIEQDIREKILKKFTELAPSLDVLIFSDFNYGCLPQSLVDELTQIARKHAITIAADSQCSSQIGDVTRFKGVDLLTPTEHEARVSLKNSYDGIITLSDDLRKKTKAKHVIFKLGRDGILLHKDDENESYTDRLEALNLFPEDVAGAGDSLLVISALTLAAKGNIWEASLLGSIGAAIQVAQKGNEPLTLGQIRQYLEIL